MAKKTPAAPKCNAKSLLIKIGVIAFVAVFVAVLAFSALRYTTGIVHRGVKAVKVGNESLSAMDLRIFYNDVRNNYLYQYGYILQLYGYDLSTIDSQTCLLDSSMTWGEYFVNQGFTQAVNVLSLNILGKAAGFEETSDIDAFVEDYIGTIEESAEAEGMSVKKYLKNYYGKGTSIKDVTKMVALSEYANQYYEYLTEGYYDSYTADDVQAYYEENKSSYDVYEYYSITIPYTKYTYTAPTDGSTIPDGQPKSEAEATTMTEDARVSAENLARSVMSELTLENAEELGKKYWEEYNDSAFETALSTNPASDIDSLIGKWCATEGNNEQGRKDVLHDSDNGEYIVIMYNQRYLPKVDTVDVRHILIETIEITSTMTDEEKAEAEKANEEAKAEAERIYDEWKSGEATEESFGVLATKYTADTGSVATGGLYENVAQGEMAEAFDEWIFDESRQAGDTEIIYSYYGYHIMYFVGEGLVQYEAAIREALAAEEYNAYYEENTKDLEVKTFELGTMLMFS
ncbi:MAG: peptidylprolyl isomerase [Clostridia bacterium]|nr:peptidylprolyl isomerase [Clostridia bacterium]